jgi:hypothetical protein
MVSRVESVKKNPQFTLQRVYERVEYNIYLTTQLSQPRKRIRKQNCTYFWFYCNSQYPVSDGSYWCMRLNSIHVGKYVKKTCKFTKTTWEYVRNFISTQLPPKYSNGHNSCPVQLKFNTLKLIGKVWLTNISSNVCKLDTKNEGKMHRIQESEYVTAVAACIVLLLQVLLNLLLVHCLRILWIQMNIEKSSDLGVAIIMASAKACLITGMRRITKFQSTTDRIYDGCPIIL